MYGNNNISGERPGLPSESRASMGPEQGPSELFFELTRQLKSRFNINRGVLLLRVPSEESLAAISTWHNGQTREGLAIKLPTESSLFAHVADDGEVYTENFCASFSGNFFEKKLLLDNSSRSFVLQPLKHDGEVIGLLGFSSEEPTAFTLFGEGVVDQMAADFAGILKRKALSA